MCMSQSASVNQILLCNADATGMAKYWLLNRGSKYLYFDADDQWYRRSGKEWKEVDEVYVINDVTEWLLRWRDIINTYMDSVPALHEYVTTKYLDNQTVFRVMKHIKSLWDFRFDL